MSAPSQEHSNGVRPGETSAFPGPLTVGRQRYLHPANTSPTCLLLIDTQRGLNTNNGFYGTDRSTPRLEDNISSLLSAARSYNTSTELSPSVTFSAKDELFPAVQIIHVFHQSSNPESPLHISGKAQKDGILFMPCAQPNEESEYETVFSKTLVSAFADGKVKEVLERMRISQLVVAGIATDHCVSTSVRWAKDLGVVKDDWNDRTKEGKIVIVSDATACFGKGGIDAETVQKVHLASLEGEFAKVMSTQEVLGDLFE
ncbi:hypothetical protein H2200_011840 [Cladophialophora chaetospira]|uniref:Isochorismatase-like domain-containing protein n=1 Tax=Cladophialophora chaetospira TaxID=386627 RepID=A0AA38WYU5_9EURO|nr:hypothetical protein H2200_011840 [Cladophialophora chaetospira]